MTAEPADDLYDRQVLVLDPGVHVGKIVSADVDRAGRFAVTGSEDKTVRIWSLTDGSLDRTIRMPSGPGNVGKVYSVAISPDGNVIAAAGWTGGDKKSVLLFDRATGRMVQRLSGFPNVITALAFSHDGTKLAALIAGLGLLLFDPDNGGAWRPRGVVDRAAAGHCIAFAEDGRLATSGFDGVLRLYESSGRLCRAMDVEGTPYHVAFNPIDGRIAVGFQDVPEVRLYSGRTLAFLSAPDLTGTGVDGRNLGRVAWSSDGKVLFAAGRYGIEGRAQVVAWDDGGSGARELHPASSSTVMSMRQLPDGALLVAAADPWLGLLDSQRRWAWVRSTGKIDPRGSHDNLAVSNDGSLVEFGLSFGGADRLRFDLAQLRFLPPVKDGRVLPPRQATLAVKGWLNGADPTFNGVPLPLEPYEISRTVAAHPDGNRYLLGTEFWLRAFDALSEPWRRPVPGPVWASNISGDGRLALAAYDDGTIRWHRMDGGTELLALFPFPDGENWVAWTPEGVYAASPGARGALRWHVNQGWDTQPKVVPASAIPKTYRPDVIPHVLPQLGTAGAIATAGLAEIRDAVQFATGSDVAPGARLHVLAIGVSDYGEAARHLELAYAHKDALDVAAALRTSQSSLYAKVFVSELVDAAATKPAIFDELAALRDAMRRGDGADVALILFSGHGEMAGDKFYLLPHGVDTKSPGAIKATALPITDLHDEIAAIAERGRVILFLDACRSGGATAPADRSLRAMLRAPNVTIFTSSSAGELSVEHGDWQNGAFTEAVLEALRSDPNGDGLLSISDLSNYLTQRVPALTGGSQRPDVEVHFDGRILVATD